MRHAIFIVSLMLLVACADKKSTNHFDEENLIKAEDVGEYHHLIDDAIKIYLPQGFKVLSESEILSFIDSIKEEEHKYYYKKSYEMRKLMSKNTYFYYHEDFQTEVQITTIPYAPFDRSTASQLLYVIRQNHEDYENVTGIAHEKITAKYIGTRGLQAFKGIYSLSNTADNEFDDTSIKLFKTVYVISSHQKSFIMNIMTPFEFDYDPFIRKTLFP